MNRLRWSCTLTFKQFVASLVTPSRSKNVRSIVNVSSVKYIVAKYVKQSGIRKRVSVHTLRHTFGAHKADKNMGIATLQEFMGHKKKETTLKYVHLAKTNLRQEMSNTAL